MNILGYLILEAYYAYPFQRPDKGWHWGFSAAGVLDADPKTGWARRPTDNIGLQYGLAALDAGKISVDEFLEVNEKVGGTDIDGKVAKLFTSKPGGLTASECLAAETFETGWPYAGHGQTRSAGEHAKDLIATYDQVAEAPRLAVVENMVPSGVRLYGELCGWTHTKVNRCLAEGRAGLTS